MTRYRSSWCRWILVLLLGLWAAPAQASEFRYRYVPLDEAALPEGALFFDPAAINNSGRVYGTVYECADPACDALAGRVGIYADGAVTVLQPGFAYEVNNKGTIGGSVLIDPVDFIEQAALFREGSGAVELVPRQPGEVTSFVVALNDQNAAVVASFDASFELTWVLYRNGQATPLDIDPTISVNGINNQGIISGLTFVAGAGSRGFRFNTRTGKATLLDPLPTEPDAWGLGINNRGDVLGYSFVAGARERIGVWNKKGVFKTYFVQGIPEFPTISNHLVFNDSNLIVATRVSRPASEVGNSYLLPKSGVRLNLADLVENLPAGATLDWVLGVNNHGDMFGFSFSGPFFSFLLQRIDDGDEAPLVAAPKKTLQARLPLSRAWLRLRACSRSLSQPSRDAQQLHPAAAARYDTAHIRGRSFGCR